MSNIDIDINPSVLSDVITSLKKDNENINEKVKLIYENINILTDDRVWNSPEKPVIMDELMPYLEERKEGIKKDFDNCVRVLDTALHNYQGTDEALRKDTDNLATVEVIEEL